MSKIAMKRLYSELKQISEDPNYFYSITPGEDNILTCGFSMIGPPDTLYEGGIFSGSIFFTNTYPHQPPTVKFNNILHPNIYDNGTVCISILHQGTDVYGYEQDYERWSPSQNINTIMLSILSLLSAPNFESPANVDASTLWQNNPSNYKQIIYKMVSLSQT